MSLARNLRELKELQNEGILTEDEFNQKKSQLLGLSPISTKQKKIYVECSNCEQKQYVIKDDMSNCSNCGESFDSFVEKDLGSVGSIGRFGRFTYLLLLLVALIINWMGQSIIEGSYSDAAMLVGLVVIIFGSCIAIIAHVGRLHDLSMSGWYTLLFLVPLVNLFLLLYLMCKSGVSDTNEYGPSLLN